jgi:tripartite ATP-independent transporter DctM subunit
MVSVLLLASFLALFLIGFPVMVAMSIPTVLYIIVHGIPIEVIAQRFHYALDSFPLLAIPVFIFAGNLMTSAGISKRIFNFADICVGKMHGGLGQVTIFASLIFAGMSGAALADIGGLGQITIKEMKDKGFPVPFSAAVTAAAATLGPIFPPSIPLVIFGAATGTSIIKLLISGIVPALFAAVAMMLLTGYLSVKRGYPRRTAKLNRKEFTESLLSGLPALLAPVILILGMVSGVFTPTECAGVTVIYMLIVGAFIYRELDFRQFVAAGFVTLQQTASICIIVASASLMGWILTIEQTAAQFGGLMEGFHGGWVMLMVIINVIFLIAGMFLDSTTSTLLLMPIVMPACIAAGINPVHLGIVIVFNLMIGLLTPPLGLSLFLINSMTGVSIPTLLKDLAPYFIPLLATLLFISFAPGPIMWLPNLLVN